MTQNIEQAILDSIENGRKIFIFGLSNKANLEIYEAFKKLESECEDVFCILDRNRDNLPNVSLLSMVDYISGVLLSDPDNYIAAFSKPNKYLLEIYGMSLCYHDAETGSTIYSLDAANNKELPLLELFPKPNAALIG